MMTAQEEDMRKAFEQFMITGKKTGKVNVVQTTSKQKVGTKDEQVLKRAEKKYWQILNAFQGTLERDWLEVDDNLEGVVSSISNLRSRIAMESRYLMKQKSKSHKPWDGCGYRVDEYSGGVLMVDDVEMALSHDLVQHEKMMAGARLLLASLSEAQETLGRRLDELMLHDMDTIHVMQCMALETSSSLSTVMSVVEKLQDVFTSLALELYRKQLLIQSVLDAMNDDLLVRDQEEVDDAGGMDDNPRRVAEKCLREWPRGSKSSHINVEMLDGLLSLGERGGR